ncbi:MAG: thiamine phosphate synthase [Lentisphaerae bacterium]|nr:thiamine phosphate synthase [Lentisphaerota bacterium]
MRRFEAAGLYLVTSQAASRGRTTLEIVEAALGAGVRLIQLREKDLPAGELVALGREVRDMTSRAGALLLINDRLDVALAVGADGVHLGREDLPIADARRLAPGLIIGGSSHSLDEALDVEAAGASYVNIGPVFATTTKAWEGAALGPDTLRTIAPRLSIPFTVMGGITAARVPELRAVGVRTVAVITAVTAAPDAGRAARELLGLLH